MVQIAVSAGEHNIQHDIENHGPGFFDRRKRATDLYSNKFIFFNIVGL